MDEECSRGRRCTGKALDLLVSGFIHLIFHGIVFTQLCNDFNLNGLPGAPTSND